VLLGLHMLVLDGIETTRRLRERHPEVAIVVLTTYADDESIMAALRAGARSYLTKDATRAGPGWRSRAGQEPAGRADPA
jgi:DNA-binding NarL/FixJ family response regulator